MPGNGKKYKKGRRKTESKLATVAKKVNTLYRARELKFTEQSLVSAYNNVGTLVLLNGTSTGDANTTRDGNKISMRSLYIGCSAVLASSTSDLMRLVIFKWKSPDGVAPIPSDVLSNVSSSYIIEAPYTFNKRKLFQVLYDKTFQVNANSNHYYSFKKLINLKGSITTYKGATASVSDMSSNALYALLCSDKAASPPTQQYRFRLTYYDD